MGDLEERAERWRRSRDAAEHAAKPLRGRTYQGAIVDEQPGVIDWDAAASLLALREAEMSENPHIEAKTDDVLKSGHSYQNVGTSPIGREVAGRAYVCGPMTGYPFYNMYAFKYVKMLWETQGWAVTTPLDCNSRIWIKHYGREFDPTEDTCDYGDDILKEMFVEDIKTLLASDAVIALTGWEKSRGATIEVNIARAFGIPVLGEEHPGGGA